MNALNADFSGLTGEKALNECFAELQKVTNSYLTEEESALLCRTAEYGAQAHEGITRQSGEPYFTHPIAVCRILALQRFELIVLQSALLHDVLEDTAVTNAEMAQEFGDVVTKIVDGVSKLDGLDGQGVLEVRAESFRKLFVATTDDLRVIIIKLADRLHNMQTLGALRPDKRVRKAKETLETYTPIADKLGLFYFRIALEELVFSHLHPWRYAVLKKHYSKRFAENTVLNSVQEDLYPLIKGLGIKASIDKRQRHLWGIYQRMKRKHNNFKAACQTVPLRIITESEDDCYRILGQLHQLYRPVANKFEDYIAAPKSNGYRSLHTSVLLNNTDVLNVQIRTKEMHRLAETGIISIWYQHLKDRSILNHPHTRQAEHYMRDWLLRLKDMVNITDDPLEFYDAIKKELASSDIRVYTPRGQVIELPNEATPVDFAYALDRELGDKCVAALVNGEPQPLYQPLLSGQMVEIICDVSSKPQASWLRFVVTAKAQTGIRYYIRNIAKQEAVILGQRLLDVALRRFGSSLEQLDKAEFSAYLKKLEISDEAFFADIGHDKRQPSLIASKLVGQKTIGDREGVLKISSAQDKSIHFGDCCYPLPHEPILGHVKPGLGVKIHRRTCVRADHSDVDDWVRVDWAEQTQGYFDAALTILFEDRRKMMADLAGVMGDLSANITDVDINLPSDREGLRLIRFYFQVRDRDHLADIVRQLRSQQGVVEIKRL